MQYHESMNSIRPSVIYDDQGRPVGVVVPYDEWLKGQKKPPAMASKEPIKRTLRAGELKRKLDWPVDPVEFQRQVRSDKSRAGEECPR